MTPTGRDNAQSYLWHKSNLLPARKANKYGEITRERMNWYHLDWTEFSEPAKSEEGTLGLLIPHLLPQSLLFSCLLSENSSKQTAATGSLKGQPTGN